LKFTKTDGNGYVFEVGECSFGRSGVHEILKMEGGICPFALVVATCLTELNPNEFVKINASDFDEKGSKTHLEMVAIEKDREEEVLKAMEPASKPEVKPEPSKELKDDVVVHILEDLPPMAGKDENYLLKKNDVVTLPKEIASVLVKKKKAKRIEVAI